MTTLYRLSTWSHGTKFYATRDIDRGVWFTAQRSSATLYGKTEARGIARRMSKLNSQFRIEIARDALREGLASRMLGRVST